MAETPARYGPTQLSTSVATIKTAGAAGTWVVLRSIVLTNTSASSVTVNVGIDTAGTDAAAERLASELPLAAKETVELLAPGFIPLLGHASSPDKLYALASAATSVNITVGAVEGP